MNLSFTAEIEDYISEQIPILKSKFDAFEEVVSVFFCPDCGGTGKITVPDEPDEKVITENNGSVTFDVGGSEVDAEVGGIDVDAVPYTYISGTDTAAKNFYVTLKFYLPTSLEYDGGVKAYKWNHETGAYEADSANDEDGSVDFTGDFSIVITNQSNVGINYTVAYTADTNAIFATAAAEDWANAEGTVDTVAKGHEIGDTGITITNVTDATAGDTSFKSATCTGTITVTGINEGKTPAGSTTGEDTLGTFKVTITEAAAPAEGGTEGGEEGGTEGEPTAEATNYIMLGEDDYAEVWSWSYYDDGPEVSMMYSSTEFDTLHRYWDLGDFESGLSEINGDYFTIQTLISGDYIPMSGDIVVVNLKGYNFYLYKGAWHTDDWCFKEDLLSVGINPDIDTIADMNIVSVSADI